jgi:hypothetical protein
MNTKRRKQEDEKKDKEMEGVEGDREKSSNRRKQEKTHGQGTW